MAHTPVERARAEAYADWLEASLRTHGVTGDYFCEEQRKRWRQESVDAFLAQESKPDFSPEILASLPKSGLII